jgi:hypothetical protein
VSEAQDLTNLSCVAFCLVILCSLKPSPYPPQKFLMAPGSLRLL